MDWSPKTSTTVSVALALDVSDIPNIIDFVLSLPAVDMVIQTMTETRVDSVGFSFNVNYHNEYSKDVDGNVVVTQKNSVVVSRAGANLVEPIIGESVLIWDGYLLRVESIDGILDRYTLPDEVVSRITVAQSALGAKLQAEAERVAAIKAEIEAAARAELIESAKLELGGAQEVTP